MKKNPISFLLIISALILFLISGNYVFKSFLNAKTKDLQTFTENLLEDINNSLKVNRIHSSIEILGISEKLFIDILKGDKTRGNPESLKLAEKLKIFFNVDLVYCLDKTGTCVLSTILDKSNNTLVGKNFSFREYFQEAIKGNTHISMHLGTVTKKRGFYYSSPVYDNFNNTPIGVIVFKMNIEKIDKIINSVNKNFNTYFISSDNKILSSNNIAEIYKYFHLTKRSFLSIDLNKESIPGQIQSNELNKQNSTSVYEIKNRNHLELLCIKSLNNYNNSKSLHLPYVAVSVPYSIWLKDFIYSAQLRIVIIISLLLLLILFLVIKFITEKINLQEQLLICSENYKSIFNSVNELIIIYDSEKKSFIEVNPFAESLSGYNTSEFLKINIDLFDTKFPSYTKEKLIMRLQSINDNECKFFEWKMRNKRNKYIWVEISASPCKIHKQKNLLLSIKNINKKKIELLKSDNNSKTTQEKCLSIISSFSSSMANQLNNPCSFIANNMTQLKYYAEIINTLNNLILNSVINDNEELKKFYAEKDINKIITAFSTNLNNTDKQVEDLAKSILYLKSMSKTDSLQEKNSLNLCLDNTIISLREKYPIDTYNIISNFSDDIPELYINTNELTIAFNNLLDLFIKYADREDTIKIQSSFFKDIVIVRIIHHGKFVLLNKIKSYLEPFFHKSDEYNTSDFNILLAYNYINKNGGAFNFYSDEFADTVFEIKFIPDY